MGFKFVFNCSHHASYCVANSTVVLIAKPLQWKGWWGVKEGGEEKKEMIKKRKIRGEKGGKKEKKGKRGKKE